MVGVGPALPDAVRGRNKPLRGMYDALLAKRIRQGDILARVALAGRRAASGGQSAARQYRNDQVRRPRRHARCIDSDGATCQELVNALAEKLGLPPKAPGADLSQGDAGGPERGLGGGLHLEFAAAGMRCTRGALVSVRLGRPLVAYLEFCFAVREYQYEDCKVAPTTSMSGKHPGIVTL